MDRWGLRSLAPEALWRYYQGGGVIGSGIGSAGGTGKSALFNRTAIAASVRLSMVAHPLQACADGRPVHLAARLSIDSAIEDQYADARGSFGEGLRHKSDKIRTGGAIRLSRWG
jgi:hypothetical protein